MKIKIEFKNGLQIIVGFFKNSYKVKVIWHVILNWEVLFNPEITGLSLRFQVAGYLLLVAGEVASSRGAPCSPKKFLKCNFYRFPKGITAQKKQSSSRAELSLVVLWWSRLY